MKTATKKLVQPPPRSRRPNPSGIERIRRVARVLAPNTIYPFYYERKDNLYWRPHIYIWNKPQTNHEEKLWPVACVVNNQIDIWWYMKMKDTTGRDANLVVKMIDQIDRNRITGFFFLVASFGEERIDTCSLQKETQFNLARSLQKSEHPLFYLFPTVYKLIAHTLRCINRPPKSLGGLRKSTTCPRELEFSSWQQFDNRNWLWVNWEFLHLGHQNTLTTLNKQMTEFPNLNSITDSVTHLRYIWKRHLSLNYIRITTVFKKMHPSLSTPQNVSRDKRINGRWDPKKKTRLRRRYMSFITQAPGSRECRTWPPPPTLPKTGCINSRVTKCGPQNGRNGEEIKNVRQWM